MFFEEHGLDAGSLSHFKDLDVGDEVTPMDVFGWYITDGAALMVTLDKAQLATIGNTGLGTIQESGQHNSLQYIRTIMYYETI